MTFKEVKDSVNSGGSGATRPRYDWMGFDRDQRGQGRGDARSEGAAPVRAPLAPDHGMTAEQLHRYQQEFTLYAANRLLTVGKEQYDEGTEQKFESMTPYELAVGLREELADVINYAVMIDILLTRIARGWNTYVKENDPHA